MQVSQEDPIIDRDKRYQKSINDCYQIQQWKLRAFKPKLLNIHNLTSTILHSNQKYTQIIQLLAKHNQRILSNGYSSEKLSKQNSTFYECLSSLMHTVICTMDNPKNQQQAMNKIYDWMQPYLNQKITNPFKDIKFQKYYFDNKNIQSQTTRDDNQQANLPYAIIENQKNDFRFGRRTLHNQLPKPSERLAQYKRRAMGIIGQTKTIPNKKYKMRAIYQKPKKYESLMQLQQKEKKQVTAIQTNQNQEREVQDQEVQQDGLPEIQILQKKKGLLDPYRKPYLMPVDRELPPKGTMKQQIKLQNRIQKKNVILENEKLQVEQDIKLLQNWGKSKSRAESQINRKIISKQSGNRFKQNYVQEYNELKKKRLQILNKDKRISKTPIVVEDIMTKKRAQKFQIKISKVNDNLKRYGKVINVAQQSFLGIDQPSLSVFSRNRIQTEYRPSRRKDLSQILNQHSLDRQREASYHQMGSIKDRLSKYNVNIPLKNLSQGLMAPQIKQNEQFELKGDNLMSNPFLIAKKKKKKK